MGRGCGAALDGEELDVEARVTVSASGAWAGHIASMAGIEGVHVIPGRGIMIAMNHRLVNTVVNRCQMPTDGDIIVPIHTVSVIGTTDVHTDDPDDHSVLQEEVDAMLEDGERLVPGFKESRALRVWTGVRPLFEDHKEDAASTRDVTRSHALLDHSQRDGVAGFFTITGGKLTTYRLMAEQTVDAICCPARRAATVHDQRPSLCPARRTASSTTSAIGSSAREASMRDDQLVCECELIPRRPARGRDARRARRRASMTSGGSSGSGWGRARAGSASTARPGSCTGSTGSRRRRRTPSLLEFLRERWKGMWPILYGDQMRQARFDEWVFQGVLDVEHLPA